MNKVEKLLKTHCKLKNCPKCENEMKPIISNETSFNPESHDGIYKADSNNWFPHYDVEYTCQKCSSYEHLTYDVDGAIMYQRINKILFSFTTNSFSILECDGFNVVAELPDSVKYGSLKWGKYLEKVHMMAYPEEE